MTTWATLRRGLGRNDLPTVLAENWHNLTPADLREALCDAWTGAEWPERHLDTDLWVGLFEDGGYQVDGEPADRTTDLPEQVTLYRGAIPRHAIGMAWTTDRRTAEWFATRFNDMNGAQTGRLYTCTIPRDLVLARFHESRPGEAEHVLDAMSLGDDDVVEVTE